MLPLKVTGLPPKPIGKASRSGEFDGVTPWRSPTRIAVWGNRQRTVNTSGIFRLPTELYWQILNDLPPITVVCLNLTCRLFWYRLISTRRDGGPLFTISERRDSEDEGGKEESERLSFLSLIERDLPGHVMCYKCQILHRRSRYERS